MARHASSASPTAARELLVACDDARRRRVYAVHSERLKQHSASVQVVADADTHCHVVWIVDLLPHAAALYISRQMDEGAAFMQKAFMGGTV